MSYAIGFRRQVLKVKEQEGLSFAKVAKRFGIGKQTVFSWSKRLEEEKTRIKPATKIDMEALKKDIEDHPDAYQYERAARFGVTQTEIWHALRRLKVTYKKNLKHPKADSARRSRFSQKINEYKDLNRSIVYIDESGFACDMPRTHGYAKKGERCFSTHDWGAKGRVNVIGALLGSVLIATACFQTTINTKVFDAWVSQDLVKHLPENSVVVMDNATFHKGVLMQKMLEEQGHTLLYLPPYSPDLNPIEHKWAQAKALRRKSPCDIEELFKSNDL